jgi:hypothetical protein
MRLERVIDFQNIGKGRTAVITLPLGPTYEALHLDLNGGLTVAHIDSVIGLIDNKPFWTATGAELAKEINYDPGFHAAERQEPRQYDRRDFAGC